MTHGSLWLDCRLALRRLRQRPLDAIMAVLVLAGTRCLHHDIRPWCGASCCSRWTTPAPEIYRPYAQMSWMSMSLAVRNSADPAKLTESVRAEVQALDRQQPLFRVR